MEREMTYQDRRVERPTTPINMTRSERLISLVGGALLAGIAVMRRGWAGLGLGTLGGTLLFRGITGHSQIYRLLGWNRALVRGNRAASVPHQQGIRVEESVTINHRVETVYDFWRDFTNLPLFMENLKSVTVESPTHSHWVVKGPAGMTVEWDAEIVTEIPNEVIAWRTIDNMQVSHAGSVHFRPAPGERGTEVHVALEYAPIAGPVGALVAKLFRRDPKEQIYDDLRRLKQILETGEVLKSDGSPNGAGQVWQRPAQPMAEDAES